MNNRKVLTWSAIGIAVLGGWYVVLVEPAMARLARAGSEIEKLKLQLEKSEVIGATRPQLEKTLYDVRLRLSARNTQDVTAELVRFLESLKVKTGASVSYKALADRQKGDILKESPLEMEGECSLVALVQILYDLGYWDEYFKISHISLSSSDKGRVRVALTGSILGVTNPIPGINPKTLKKMAIAPSRPALAEFESVAKKTLFGEGVPSTLNPSIPIRTTGRGTLFLRGIYKGPDGDLKALLEDSDGIESKTIRAGGTIAGYRVDEIEKDKVTLSRGPEIVKLKLGDFLIVVRESK